MSGDDVRDFQRLLNHRFAAWKIGRQVAVDGDYGKDTREAATQVCIGLGIVPETAMEHGVTPELRIKLRHPDRRTPNEIERARGAEAKRFRASCASSCGARPPHRRRAVRRQAGRRLDRSVAALGARSRLGRGRRERLPHVRAPEGGRRRVRRQPRQDRRPGLPERPCASDHVGADHPRGAVDVTNPEQLAEVLKNSPKTPKLVWGGPVINDRVHFSANGLTPGRKAHHGLHATAPQ